MAASSSSMDGAHRTSAAGPTFHEKLNSQWHERGLQIFMLIVLAHWAEHLAQAIQVFILDWPRPKANGVLGLWYPWLIKSEVMHYLYALVMLVGIWVLLKGFTGVARKWWMAALVVQFWHHIEHLLLIWQAAVHHNFWGRPVPFSVLQLVIPRVELHLFYNTVVFIPMVIAMYYHMFPPAEETERAACTCAWHPRTVEARAF